MERILPKSNMNINNTTFQGDAFFNLIVLYFLSHKHENVCSILFEQYETDHKKSPHWFNRSDAHIHDDNCILLPKHLKHIPDEHTDVSLRYIQMKNKSQNYISVPKPAKKFWKDFKKCTNKRFVILPFGFSCIDSGHANYLLYDKKHRTLERFEPFGYLDDDFCLNPENLDEKILQLFRKNLGNDYVNEYFIPLTYLTKENFQTIQENEN